MTSEPNPEPELVAIVLPTLFAGPATDASARDKVIIDVARDWQRMGVWAHMVEIHGMMHGIVEGRLTEIIGRIAAAGEQVGLASTCCRDAHRWLVQPENNISRPIASRSLAEMAGYYSLSAAHGLGNVTLRTLLLDPSAAAVLNKKYKGAAGFPPFTDERDAWRPLSANLVGALQDAADATQKEAARSLVGILADLVHDPRWVALDNRRSTDFHRWRPQSVTGGVPQRNPWDSQPNGQRVMSVMVSNGYIVPDHEALVSEADEALATLAMSMQQWLDLFPHVTQGLGVPLFAIPEGQ